MEAFLIEREPGEEKVAEPLRQYTEEFIYVLEGQLLVELNYKTFLLDAGDSIYFEGPLLQRIEAAGDSTLRFISVITPPVF
jgi:quercetin dioxygenase-like cupin family protein